jgi:hypothetical protein
MTGRNGNGPYERELGAIGEKVIQLKEAQDVMREDTERHREFVRGQFNEMDNKIETISGEVREGFSEINSKIDKFEGGWKAAAIIAAIVSGTVAFISAVAKFAIWGIPK